jgi:hypothetical protein
MKKASEWRFAFASAFKCSLKSPQNTRSFAFGCQRRRHSTGHCSGFAPGRKGTAGYDKGGAASRCFRRDVISVLQGAMAGVSRRLLESDAPHEQFATLQQELILFICTYLKTCSARSAA